MEELRRKQRKEPQWTEDWTRRQEYINATVGQHARQQGVVDRKAKQLEEVEESERFWRRQREGYQEKLAAHWDELMEELVDEAVSAAWEVVTRGRYQSVP